MWSCILVHDNMKSVLYHAPKTMLRNLYVICRLWNCVTSILQKVPEFESPPIHPSTCPPCPDSTWQRHNHPRLLLHCPWLLPSSCHCESIYFLHKSFKQPQYPLQSRQGSSNPSQAWILLEGFNATPYGTSFHVTYGWHLCDTDCSWEEDEGNWVAAGGYLVQE